MINEFSKVLTISCMIWSGIFGDFNSEPIVESDLKVKEIRTIETETETEIESEDIPFQSYEIEKQMISGIVETESSYDIFTEEEINLIALVTMAEAEGESEYGKRLVIDTIINRVNSEYFPDTVNEVIYQPYQFESMWNGRIDRCYVDEYICELVREEMVNITDPYTMFFCAGDYSRYGDPMYQVGNHYFSSY